MINNNAIIDNLGNDNTDDTTDDDSHEYLVVPVQLVDAGKVLLGLSSQLSLVQVCTSDDPLSRKKHCRLLDCLK